MIISIRVIFDRENLNVFATITLLQYTGLVCVHVRKHARARARTHTHTLMHAYSAHPPPPPPTHTL